MTGNLRVMFSIHWLRPFLCGLICGAALVAADSVSENWSTAVEAVRSGDDVRLSALLAEQPRLALESDSRGDSLLLIAGMMGSADSLRLLLDHGAHVNAANEEGATALIRAAADPVKTAILLEHGAEPNAETHWGHTPLMLAARSPSALDSVRLLLEKGAAVNAKSVLGGTALMAACAGENIEAVKLLVQNGADVNTPPTPRGKGDAIFGGLRTALDWAALRGATDIVEYLLDHGADVQGFPPMFSNPLASASWFGSVETAGLLLKRGADVNKPEAVSGYAAIHWAASLESRDPKLLNLLLANGADPNASGGQPVDAFMGDNKTPAKLAWNIGESALTDALREAGADLADASPTIASIEGVEWIDPSPRAVWSAMASAIPLLQHTADVSRKSFLAHSSQQNCVTCHQQYLPMTAVGLARSRKVPVDEEAAARQFRLFKEVHDYEELDAQPAFHPEPALTFGYSTLQLVSNGIDDRAAADIFAHHLAAIQCGDGSWPLNLIRPPLQSSKVEATAFGVYVLKNAGWPARAGEFEERIQRGRKWLSAVQPAFHVERAFQLLGLHWAGASQETLRPLAEALARRQRSDGGWGQHPGLPSDAYASGLALYVMQEAGGMQADDATIQRGLRYLVSTQGEDGTWHVKRRAFPFQPTMDSGYPHGRDSWISAAASSWAVLALALSLDPRAPELTRFAAGYERPASVQKVLANATAPKLDADAFAEQKPIDFAKDIQPILERSCLQCHSGKRAKSKFSLTSRGSVLATGNQGSPSVLPGHARDSRLIHVVSDQIEDLEMPPLGKRDKFPALTKEEIVRLGAWIDQELPWPEGVVLEP